MGSILDIVFEIVRTVGNFNYFGCQGKFFQSLAWRRVTGAFCIESVMKKMSYLYLELLLRCVVFRTDVFLIFMITNI